VIRLGNRDKGVSIKLGNMMTESHGLDVDKKSYPTKIDNIKEETTKIWKTSEKRNRTAKQNRRPI
jgi:hypothetical protein